MEISLPLVQFINIEFNVGMSETSVHFLGLDFGVILGYVCHLYYLMYGTWMLIFSFEFHGLKCLFFNAVIVLWNSLTYAIRTCNYCTFLSLICMEKIKVYLSFINCPIKLFHVTLGLKIMFTL